MLNGDILDRGSYGHFFVDSRSSSQVAIKSRTANVGQTAHSLDTQVTLQRHLFPYFLVDASSPRLFLLGRRAPTLRKARLKKSSSRVLFANSLSLRICLRKISWRDRPGGGFGLVESITPDVKQSATYSELSGEPDNVIAGIHSLNSLPAKFVAIPLSLFSFHFAAPFPQSVLHQTVSL